MKEDGLYYPRQGESEADLVEPQFPCAPEIAAAVFQLGGAPLGPAQLVLLGVSGSGRRWDASGDSKASPCRVSPGPGKRELPAHKVRARAGAQQKLSSPGSGGSSIAGSQPRILASHSQPCPAADPSPLAAPPNPLIEPSPVPLTGPT